MLNKNTFLALVAVSSLTIASSAFAAGTHGPEAPPEQEWSFAGIFGTFDRAQLQRGFQVYKEVCASCHSMDLVSFRNLAQPGGPEIPVDQVKAIAASYKIKDLNDAGEPTERPGELKDRFVNPFPNKLAAAAANNGKAPPDLSVIAKARTYYRGFPLFVFDAITGANITTGPNYIYGVLTGYEDAPEGVEVPAGGNYNKYFPGNFIAMPNMLSDGLVTYQDGSPQTASQYAQDVTAFLMWTAEPKLEERKRIGFQVMVFMLLFTGLVYFTKKKIWSSVSH